MATKQITVYGHAIFAGQGLPLGPLSLHPWQIELEFRIHELSN